jgi:hypothetical protein
MYGPNGKPFVLKERAWVLQEATLSPRILVFANDQLYHRCVLGEHWASWDSTGTVMLKVQV